MAFWTLPPRDYDQLLRATELTPFEVWPTAAEFSFMARGPGTLRVGDGARAILCRVVQARADRGYPRKVFLVPVLSVRESARAWCTEGEGP